MCLGEETVCFGTFNVSNIKAEIVPPVDTVRMRALRMSSFYATILRIQRFVWVVSP